MVHVLLGYLLECNANSFNLYIHVLVLQWNLFVNTTWKYIWWCWRWNTSGTLFHLKSL